MFSKLQLANLRWRIVIKLYCSILCTVIILIVTITCLVIVYGDYFICFDNECNPLSNALIQFQEISSGYYGDYDDDNKSMEEIENLSFYSNIDKLIDCGDNKKRKINISLISLSLIIGQRRGGTSWLRQILMKHSQIIDLEEILRIWYNIHCSKFNFLLDDHDTNQCDTKSMILTINNAYLNGINQYFCSSINYKRIVFIGKIQIEQLLGKHLKTLIKYIEINNIKIIHFERGAIIASYLSYSFDEIERISNLNSNNFHDLVERNRSIKNKKLSKKSIYLQPSLAVDYVKKIEQKHKEFKTFILENNNIIHYISIYYEYLMDSMYSNNIIYLKMIQSFLEIEAEITSTNISKYKREHPLPCYQKIENWNQIKNDLLSIGSVSVIACQMFFS